MKTITNQWPKQHMLTVITFIRMLFLANAIPGGRTKIKDEKNNQEMQELLRYSLE